MVKKDRKKEKKKQPSERLQDETIKAKEKKVSRKDDKATSKKFDNLTNNVYNTLFDEIIGFENELLHLNAKAVRQKLILLDGKMLWLENISNQSLLHEEESESIIDMEMGILEMGMDLEAADEMKMAFEPMEVNLGLEDYKAEIADVKSFGNDIKNIIKDFLEDDPTEDLLSKFILFELRGILERATNDVFQLEGKIKQLQKTEGNEKKIEHLENAQKKAVKAQLHEMINKLKKEKPSLILSDEKIKLYNGLTAKEIVELKRKEEQQFDKLVGELDSN